MDRARWKDVALVLTVALLVLQLARDPWLSTWVQGLPAGAWVFVAFLAVAAALMFRGDGEK